jgi:hypothetical protein
MQHLIVSPETVRLPTNAYGVCQGVKDQTKIRAIDLLMDWYP